MQRNESRAQWEIVMGVSICVCIGLVRFVSRTQATRLLDTKNGCGFTNDSIGRCNFFSCVFYIVVEYVYFISKKRWQKCSLRGLFVRILNDVYIYFSVVLFVFNGENWNS